MDFKVGDMVRVIKGAYAGRVGKVLTKGTKGSLVEFSGGLDNVWLGTGVIAPALAEKEKAKGIRIKMEKVWKDGKKYVKVLKIEALTKADLPEEYLEGACCFLHSRDRALYCCDGEGYATYSFLEIGNEYSFPVFQDRLDLIKRCGERLREINQKRQWSGIEEYVI